MTEATATPVGAWARHRLAWLDQLAFELFRSTGRSQLMQCLWLYDREADTFSLAQTQARLAALSFNRLIEPSSLPLARPRWVRPATPPEPFDAEPGILPRAELLCWANGEARRPLDPIAGPAWRMAMQRFDDGSTAVSLVGSHLMFDGMGALLAIDAAANGVEVANRYDTQGERRLIGGALSDMRQIIYEAPRTLAAFSRLALSAWRGRAGPKGARAAQPAVRHAYPANDDPAAVVNLAAAAVSIDAAEWDACAQRLGGHASTLLPGVVATLAAKLGRRRPSDGAVSLLVPVDRRRGLADERALAIAFRAMAVVPDGLATDLRPLKAPFKALLRGVKEKEADPLAPLLPAIAWMPRTIATALVNRLFTYADERPVSCSNLGTLPDGLGRIDGARCGRVLARAVDANVTRRDLERSHGHLVVVASRHGGAVSLCIEACQLNPTPTTTAELRSAVSRTLADFGLDAVIET